MFIFYYFTCIAKDEWAFAQSFKLVMYDDQLRSKDHIWHGNKTMTLVIWGNYFDLLLCSLPEYECAFSDFKQGFFLCLDSISEVVCNFTGTDTLNSSWAIIYPGRGTLIIRMYWPWLKIGLHTLLSVWALNAFGHIYTSFNLLALRNPYRFMLLLH
jgi:hypothetical protein